LAIHGSTIGNSHRLAQAISNLESNGFAQSVLGVGRLPIDPTGDIVVVTIHVCHGNGNSHPDGHSLEAQANHFLDRCMDASVSNDTIHMYLTMPSKTT